MHKRMVFTLALLLTASVALAGDSYAIKAAGYLKPDGSIEKDITLLVIDGKIGAIGKDVSVPNGVAVVDRSDQMIGPGLVDVHTTLGTNGRNFEQADSVQPQAATKELFDPDHHDFKEAAAAGITTVIIAPASTHLIGGRTVVVKTGGPSEERMLGEGPLKLSLTQDAFNMRRTPTSLTGGLYNLRQMIAAAEKNKNDKSAFARWARGESHALVEVATPEGVSTLAQFAEEQGVKCVALYANQAAERLDDAKSLGQPIVLGTYEFSDPRRYTRNPHILASNDIPFALTSSAPRYQSALLRVGAAMVMKQGAPRSAVAASLTTVPAEIAGVAKRVGSLTPGTDADFILYSGDPLDLRSRIGAVFIGGERVHVSEALASHDGSKEGGES